MIITRTPFRMSFFGGGTDYPPWYREHGGEVLATTIDKYCHISIRHLPPFFEHKHRIVYSKIECVRDVAEIQHPAVRGVLEWSAAAERGLEIHHDGDLPARAGLGSSSSFTVGLLHGLAALQGRMITKQRLAEDAIHVEQNVIGENVGSQDQVSAAFGGLNHIEFHRDGGISVAPVVAPAQRVEELQSHLMLCFTGLSRIASEVAKTKIQNLGSRVSELTRMREQVREGMDILRNERTPIDEFGKLLHQAWLYKRSLASNVTTPEVDAIYDAAMSHGALGGKLLGAGGGGFVLLFVPPDRQPAVRQALSTLVHVPVRFEQSGSRVVLYQPNGLG